MKEVLWFRRDLRINDNAILSHAKKDVLPIFIFDTNILDELPKDDRRVGLIYYYAMKLKEDLQKLGLDLAIFHGEPKTIFEQLKHKGFDRVLCSVDFDKYAIKRDKEVEKILPMERFIDSFILDPKECVKKDGTPYKVFTPFYKSLKEITTSLKIQEYKANDALKKIPFDYDNYPSIDQLGFTPKQADKIFYEEPYERLEKFLTKLPYYDKMRDYFALDGTSLLSVFLRFGVLSPKEVFNYYRLQNGSETFISELFWREFYNTILYHFPESFYKNFNGKLIEFRNSVDDFAAWRDGKTGIPLIDAAMIHLKNTGLMHNRLRMLVASFLCKNLLIDWRWGEEYFAKTLLDYEASSNIGSWQWAASTGADAVPYFRIFNPYTQSLKFDKEGLFIKSVIPELESLDPKLFHKENGVQSSLIPYPKTIVSIDFSRKRALQAFKKRENAIL